MIKDIPQSLIDAVKKVLYESVEHPMIEVDGVMKHRHNSLGQPIHHTDEGIRNFHRWFGDSQVVDELGRPKVMYHGTTSPKNFATFKQGTGGIDELGKGIYFADKTYASFWARGNSARIMPVYLKAEKLFNYSKFSSNDDLAKHIVDEIHKHAKKHPNEISHVVKGYLEQPKSFYARYIKSSISSHMNEWLKTAGYDGGYDKHSQIPTQIVVFDQNNIKSAIGNNGKFSTKKNSISESAIEHPMIEVDGVMRHRNNSLGQPIHHTDEGIKNFHRWFGDSKTVDEHGRPQVFYHGTASDIKQFHPSFLGHGLDQYGTGFYFADSPYIANSYVHGNPSVSHTASPNILPVYLSINKPINTSDESPFKREHIKKLIQSAPNHRESLENFGDIGYEGYEKVLNAAVNAHLDIPKHTAMNYINNDFYSDHPQEFVKNLKQITGHGGVVNDRDEQRIVTIFDPKDIKSATGNNGNFSKSENITEGKK